MKTKKNLGSRPVAAPTTDLKFCINCGQKVPSLVSFCPKCGGKQ